MNDQLAEDTPDITIITEHGYVETDIRNVRLKGYSLIDSFSRTQHLKGGVAIYVSENLKNQSTSLNASQYSQELLCEIAAVKLQTKPRDTYIIGVYRPDYNLDDALETLGTFLDTIPTWKSTVILMGDINVDSLDEDSKRTKTLQTFLKTYNITRLYLPPTRITPHSQTSIDFICTNLGTSDIASEVMHTFISDHTGQMCTIYVQRSGMGNMAVQKRSFTRRNLLELKEHLNQQSWEEVYAKENADEAYTILHNIVNSIINSTCPIKINRIKKTKKPMFQDTDTKKSRSEFLLAQEKYILCGKLEDKQEAASKKKAYDLLLKKKRKDATAKSIDEAENKSQAIWKIINSERESKKDHNTIQQLEVDGDTIHSPLKIANQMNIYLASVAKTTLAHQPKTIQKTLISKTTNFPCLVLQPTTSTEIKQIIQLIKPKTSTGIDDISPKTLKLCKDELAQPLVNIVNKSFAQGIFPSLLKIAKVHPKFKQGDRKQPSNYRPISLLSTFSKIIEKIVLNRLLLHIKSFNILTIHQHGFTPGRSTVTALISLIEELIDNIESGNTATTILLDYSKAFDCLNHEMLMKKLEGIGVTGVALTWFKSYLEGRTQVVEVSYTDNGTTQTIRSDMQNLDRGVPQGSVLGPVLYIIFTSDMPNFMKQCCSVLMYADDTVLIKSTKTPEELEINSYIAFNMALEYCHSNDLAVNERKSTQLFFGPKKHQTSEIPGLNRTENAKYLGVIIDSNLSWNQHVDTVCSKLSSGIFVIKRLKSITENQSILRTAYFALAESHLRYGLVLWGNSSKSNLQRVLVQQKKIIRTMLGLGPQESCRGSFINLNILTVVALYILEVILHAAGQDLPRGNTLHNHFTRNSSNYALPNHRLTLYEKKPSYIGAQLTNCLPDELKTPGPINHKRKQLISWLQVRPLYSIEEFIQWREEPWLRD